MNDIEQLNQRNQRIFVLICFNFAMLLILFIGFGLVLWKSSNLISKINEDLTRAEQAVVETKQKLQNLDMDTLMEKVVSSAGVSVDKAVRNAITESEFKSSLENIANRVDDAQTRLQILGDTLVSVNKKIQEFDTRQMAQLVSYNMLKGIGDGFTSAAEANKPAGIVETEVLPATSQ